MPQRSEQGPRPRVERALPHDADPPGCAESADESRGERCYERASGALEPCVCSCHASGERSVAASGLTREPELVNIPVSSAQRGESKARRDSLVANAPTDL